METSVLRREISLRDAHFREGWLLSRARRPHSLRKMCVMITLQRFAPQERTFSFGKLVHRVVWTKSRRRTVAQIGILASRNLFFRFLVIKDPRNESRGDQIFFRM